MQLLAFRVQHFRCLYDTDWIPFFDLTLFTGENDGGKSTTLAALCLFLDPRAAPTNEDFSFAAAGASEGTRESTMEMRALDFDFQMQIRRFGTKSYRAWQTKSRSCDHSKYVEALHRIAQ